MMRDEWIRIAMLAYGFIGFAIAVVLNDVWSTIPFVTGLACFLYLLFTMD